MKQNIMVVFGGKSTEHDISILSAMQTIENLDKEKYNIIPVYITKKGKWLTNSKFDRLSTFQKTDDKVGFEVALLPSSDYLYIKKMGGLWKYKKIDCAFLIMHGKNGEDGTIQGLCELADIPYTSSGVLASSLGISKLAQKIYFQGLNLPVVPYFYVTINEYQKLNKKIDIGDFSFPVIVKPNRLGSSIGIAFCENQNQLDKAIELAFMFDDTLVIEKAITDIKEVNISALGSRDEILLSNTEQPISENSILTFTDKYITDKTNKKSGSKYPVDKKGKDEKMLKIARSSGTKMGQNGMQSLSRKVPADIDKNSQKQIEQMAREIFEKLECKGVIRIDFIIDQGEDIIYINEVNTIPGSLAFYLWENKGLSFKKELDKIIAVAIKEKEDKNKFQFIFDSNVLK